MKDKHYDLLKHLVIYVMPAASTLYAALSSIWGLPYGMQVTSTITALNTFMAGVLGLSTAVYNKKGEKDEK